MCRKSKDASSSKKSKENDAGPSRPPPKLKKKAQEAQQAAQSNGYLDGIDLPSSASEDEGVEIVDREEKHFDVSQQVCHMCLRFDTCISHEGRCEVSNS